MELGCNGTYFSGGMEVSHDKAPSRFLAPWHIAVPWTARASVPSLLWLHYCGANVNGDLYLSLFQTCTNRVISVLLSDELHYGAITDEQAVN